MTADGGGGGGGGDEPASAQATRDAPHVEEAARHAESPTSRSEPREI